MYYSSNYDLPHFTDKFIRHLKRHNFSEETFTGYAKDLKIFNEFIYAEYNGNVLLEQLKRHDLQDYLSYLFEVKNYKHNSIQRHLSTLKSFYRFLVNEVNFPENIAATIRHKAQYTPLPQILTEEEVERLLQAALEYSFYDYVLINVLYYTGSRITATLNIKKDNVNLVEEQFYFEKIKGGRDLYLPTHTKLIAILNQFLEKHPAPESPYLFHSPHHPMRPIDAQTVRGHMKKIKDRAGITKRVTPHVIRHSMATHLTIKGVDQTTLMLILGQNDPRAVIRYQHLVTEHLIDPINKLR